MLRLSPFAISIYQQCPRRYKYQYVDGLIQQYRKPWPWLAMEQNVHAALADLLNVVPVEKRTAETLENLLRSKWRMNREGLTDAEEEQWGERALSQLRLFVTKQRVDVHPLSVEKLHEAPITQDVILTGKIDRIDREDDGSLHVIDYKTGNMPETVDSFQLLCYALILSRTLSSPVSKASYLYLDDGVWYTFPIVEYSVQDARDQVLEIAQRIELERDYPEVTSPLCRFCDFVELCDVASEFQSINTDTLSVDF